MVRTLLSSCLLVLLPACVASARKEPWAPVELRTDPALWNVDNEVFVYVDDVYRGNLVDGVFRIFLTLEPHQMRVHFPGRQPWEREVTLTDADYPEGIVLVLAPPPESAD